MEEPKNRESGIPGMSIRDFCEAAADADIRLGGASVASISAAAAAALLSRAARTDDPKGQDSVCMKAISLSFELVEMAGRLDAADELISSFKGMAPTYALSAGIDASIALLEASYFGQSLAKLASETVDRPRALDLATASMLLDAAAGSALMSASFYMAGIQDPDVLGKSEELIWAITHDRIGLKKQVLDITDKLIRRQ